VLSLTRPPQPGRCALLCRRPALPAALVNESAQLHCELTEVMTALIEHFPDMDTADLECVHDVFCGLVK
jgi:hypothetical protein